MMVVLIFGSVFLGLLLKGIDRILSARMQKRVGPPLLQPFYDFRKLMVKESIVPKYASKWIFSLAPLVSLTVSILILFYLPIAGVSVLSGAGDLILIIYLFIFPGLCLALGAFASNSPYANLGGQRSIINMLGYEFPLAIVCLAPAWMLYQNGFSAPFSLTEIYSANIWSLAGPLGTIGLLLETVVIFIIVSAEIAKRPFDLGAADSEIAGGVLSEYSGRNLAMFYLAEAVKIVAVAALFVSLFFPWSVVDLFGSNLPLHGAVAWAVNIGFYLLKIFLLVFIGLTLIRTAASRFKISRLTRTYWGYMALLAAFGFLLIL